MSKIIIQIDDSDVAIKRLSSILDMKICTPLYRRRVHDFTKRSGTFEIRIGDFVCYFPQMMTKLNKRLLIAKIEGISTKEPSLDKKKQSLKDVSIDFYSYAIQDRMQETAINIYQAMPKASMGPERVPRPKLISPITPVKPISATKIKYGIRNDPPPYRETLVGNIQIFPIPTADPMQARMNPQRLLKDSRFFIKIKFPLSVDRFSIT